MTSFKPRILDCNFALTWPEIVIVRSLADTDLAAALTLGVCCGATAQEIDSLDWGDINVAKGTIALGEGFTHRNVFLPVCASDLLSSGFGPENPMPYGGLVWATTTHGTMQSRWHLLLNEWWKAFELSNVVLPPPTISPPFEALRDFTIRMLLQHQVCPKVISDWAGVAVKEVLQ